MADMLQFNGPEIVVFAHDDRVVLEVREGTSILMNVHMPCATARTIARELIARASELDPPKPLRVVKP